MTCINFFCCSSDLWIFLVPTLVPAAAWVAYPNTWGREKLQPAMEKELVKFGGMEPFPLTELDAKNWGPSDKRIVERIVDIPPMFGTNFRGSNCLLEIYSLWELSALGGAQTRAEGRGEAQNHGFKVLTRLNRSGFGWFGGTPRWGFWGLWERFFRFGTACVGNRWTDPSLCTVDQRLQIEHIPSQTYIFLMWRRRTQSI